VPLKRIAFMSREKAERMIGRSNMAIISITESGVEPADLRGQWGAVLRIQFDDREYEDPQLITFDDSHAEQIARFIESMPRGIDELHVHCWAGVSRSAAVAMCIANQLGIGLDGDTEFHNRLVHRVLSKWFNTQMLAGFKANQRYGVGGQNE
jgi:predicted protein tyrosine phosphatase